MNALVELEQLRSLDIAKIHPGRWQPRKKIDPAYVKKLSKSIGARGLDESLVVTEVSEGRFEIISGENRYHALILLGIQQVKCIVRARVNDEDLMVSAIINNGGLPLTPIEKAEAYMRLSNTMTHNEIAVQVGEQRVTVTKLLRLLKLPSAVRTLIHEGDLSPTHGHELLVLENSNKQVEIAALAASNQWSVKKLKKVISESNQSTANTTQDWLELEEAISEKTGFPVKLRHTTSGYKVSFNCNSEDEIRRLMERLS